MPINCLVNSEQIVKNSCSKNQFMVNSWTIHEHSCFKKTALSPFVFRPPSLPLLSSLFLSLPLFSSLFLSLPLFLSFFNVYPANPANYLKTKDLRKRHFWLKFLSQGKPLRHKTLCAKAAQKPPTSPPTLHSTRRPKLTLHTPPRNPTSCKVLCRICQPNATHSTALKIKS